MTESGVSLVRLRDGEVVLYRRPRSSKWQARIKVSGRWHRISTGERDPERAGAKACRRQDEMQLRVEVGRPPIARTFKQVAELAISDMKAQSEAGEGRVAFKDYIGALNRYFIPYFGRRSVDAITWRDLQEFNIWRVKKLGRVPKASTLNNHNAALRKVFNTAVAEAWMPEARVPLIPGKGAEGSRRPTFTEEEIDLMDDDFFPRWINLAAGEDGVPATRNPKTPHIRSLLHDYSMFVADTGVRPGTEMRNMRWCDIERIKLKGRDYWVAKVRGKTGAREIVLDHFATVALNGRMSLLDAAPKPSDRVWLLPDGHEPRDLHGAFEQFLTWAKLLEDGEGKRRTLYSLRHYYATKRIIEGSVDLHTLARQMGTSVGMIEKHYSHLKPRQKAKELAGMPLPSALTEKFQLAEWFQAQHRRRPEGDAA